MALYVVSDCVGYVGTFSSLDNAMKETYGKFTSVPFILQKFMKYTNAPEYVWVIMYRDIEAVAFVSDSKDETVKMKKAYDSVGLSYEGDIDCWKQPFDKISPFAETRLKGIQIGNIEYGNELSLYENEVMMSEYSSCGKMFANDEKYEKIPIFEFVVPKVIEASLKDEEEVKKIEFINSPVISQRTSTSSSDPIMIQLKNLAETMCASRESPDDDDSDIECKNEIVAD